jgi:hypothetical protein
MSVRALVWFPGNGQDANERGTYVFAHGGGAPDGIVPKLLHAHDLGRTPVRSVAWPEQEYDEVATCHLIPIGFVPPDPDRSAVSWTKNRISLWRSP